MFFANRIGPKFVGNNNNNNIFPFQYTNTDRYKYNADMNISPVTWSKKIAWFSTFCSFFIQIFLNFHIF